MIENKRTILFKFLVTLESINIVFQIGHISNMIIPKVLKLLLLYPLPLTNFNEQFSVHIKEAPLKPLTAPSIGNKAAKVQMTLLVSMGDFMIRFFQKKKT